MIIFKLNFVLIPEHLAAGAAITTVVTQVFLFLGMLYYSNKQSEHLHILKLTLQSTVLVLLANILAFYSFKLEVQLFTFSETLFG